MAAAVVTVICPALVPLHNLCLLFLLETVEFATGRRMQGVTSILARTEEDITLIRGSELGLRVPWFILGEAVVEIMASCPRSFFERNANC